MNDRTVRPWLPGGDARSATDRTRIDSDAVFVAPGAQWDRADEVTLAHALSFSDKWLARSDMGPAPDGHALVDTLRIEIGAFGDIDRIRTPENEKRRAIVDSITVILDCRNDLLGTDRFELCLPTDVALLRRREDGLEDHQSPVITTRSRTSGAGVIGEMMAQAYGPDAPGAAARRRFRRLCVETLRSYPALRDDAGAWLIRDSIREQVVPLIEHGDRPCVITIAPDGLIGIEYAGGSGTPRREVAR